jgi:heptosyltransferase-1
MKRVLLVKLTSMGDLIHALPALSDALAAYPDLAFDWVVDQSFYEIAQWHPAVHRVFKTNHRGWRKRLLHYSTAQSIYHLIRDIRRDTYDLIIDGQGNFKSALVALLSSGPTAGYDKHSVREWIAHLSYQKCYTVSKQGHAIDRLRRLFALSIGYPLPLSLPNFQIQRDKFIRPSVSLPAEYLVFIHNATWKTKLWKEEHWIELIKKTAADGFTVLLPWGNAQELARAQRLAMDPHVHILPKLSLSEMGYVLQGAKACVAMDTGLAHLSAALNIPTVTLYGATNPSLIGTVGLHQKHLLPSLQCAPCQKKACLYTDGDAPCLSGIGPDQVYNELLRQASLRYL